jgi:hypothetical protein
MNELATVDKGAAWRRLKALVFDSVCPPITKRVYNPGLDEFFALVWPGAAAGLYEEFGRLRKNCLFDTFGALGPAPKSALVATVVPDLRQERCKHFRTAPTQRHQSIVKRISSKCILTP